MINLMQELLNIIDTDKLFYIEFMFDEVYENLSKKSLII